VTGSGAVCGSGVRAAPRRGWAGAAAGNGLVVVVIRDTVPSVGVLKKARW
jgi:hypothetical protein